MNETRTFTLRARPHLDEKQHEVLNECGKLLSKVTRALFASLCKGISMNELKRQFIVQFGITARHFNACRIQLEGMIKSKKTSLPMQIASLDWRIQNLEKKLKKQKNPFSVHQKKRKLLHLKRKQDQLEADRKSSVKRLCFGSKKLFHKQFYLEENGYKNHQAWRATWQDARNNEFFLVGSKDETAGNVNCVATLQQDQTFTLRMRLPNALKEFGTYLYLQDVSFAYGHDYLMEALRQKQAISFRFVRDEKGWEVFASIALKEPQWISDERHGVIGVDCNTDHLAIVETDARGNPIAKHTLPLNLYGKNKKQRAAIIGDTCAELVELARQKQKPIIIEDLDFTNKKTALHSAAGARTLHLFAYSAIRETLVSRAWRNAIKVHTVNSAYTSVIGQVKFKDRYGLSTHHAAALCIARRFFGFSEQPTRCLIKFTDNKGVHVAFPLPERNRGKHVWTLWSKVAKEIQAVHEARFRATKRRSKVPPLPNHKIYTLESLGEIPKCEPLAELLG
jgi:IS605 OrfB family transposase